MNRPDSPHQRVTSKPEIDLKKRPAKSSLWQFSLSEKIHKVRLAQMEAEQLTAGRRNPTQTLGSGEPPTGESHASTHPTEGARPQARKLIAPGDHGHVQGRSRGR